MFVKLDIIQKYMPLFAYAFFDTLMENTVFKLHRIPLLIEAVSLFGV